MGEKPLGEYVKGRKDGTSELGEVLARRKKQKIEKLEELEIDTLIAEKKRELKVAEKKNQPVQQGKSQDLVALLLSGRKPEEVKQILESLGPDEIQKLALIAASQNGNQTALLMQVLGKQGTDVKDTIELIHTINKMTQPAPNQSSGKELIEAFRVGLEAAKAQQPPPGSKENPMELAMRYIKPMYEAMSEKDKALYAEQIRNLESRIVDPIAYLERIKEVAPSLGFVPAGQGGKANIELEKERLGLEKWKIEQEWKREDRNQELLLKRQTEKERLAFAEKVIGRALKSNVVKGAVKGLQSKVSRPSQPGLSAKEMQNKFLCPDCLEKGKRIFIDASGMPDSLTCPECGREFSKQK